MIPIPVEADTMLSILNLPKEMGDNGLYHELTQIKARMSTNDG
ncbi:hypothetical protein MASR2M64_17040 [Candidatus Cloacimonadota bacterium]